MAFLDEDSHPGAKGCGCVLALLWLGAGVLFAGLSGLAHGPCEDDPGRTCGIGPVVPLAIIAISIALGFATRWLIGESVGRRGNVLRGLSIVLAALLVAALAYFWIGILVL